MNYLAHLYLSAHSHDLMVGNFIGDSVKGNDFNNYEEGIKNGILMHRAIDDFTDHHELVIKSKQFFVKDFDKYSGVLIDVYFDYFLAKEFSNYSAIDLATFAINTYNVLENNKHVFPEKASGFFNYMVKENILLRYAEIESIKRVLQGLTHRINKRFLLHDSLDEFQNNEGDLYVNFVKFFDELKVHLGKSF